MKYLILKLGSDVGKIPSNGGSVGTTFHSHSYHNQSKVTRLTESERTTNNRSNTVKFTMEIVRTMVIYNKFKNRIEGFHIIIEH